MAPLVSIDPAPKPVQPCRTSDPQEEAYLMTKRAIAFVLVSVLAHAYADAAGASQADPRKFHR